MDTVYCTVPFYVSWLNDDQCEHAQDNVGPEVRWIIAAGLSDPEWMVCYTLLTTIFYLHE